MKDAHAAVGSILDASVRLAAARRAHLAASWAMASETATDAQKERFLRARDALATATSELGEAAALYGGRVLDEMEAARDEGAEAEREDREAEPPAWMDLD